MPEQEQEHAKDSKRRDFFELCRNNSDALRSRMTAAQRENESQIGREQLAKTVENNAWVSINRTGSSIMRLHSDGEITNIHKSGGKIAADRMAWDTAFVGGTEFLYGALNIGSNGVRKFGPICVLVKPAILGNGVGYLWQDSLSCVGEGYAYLRKEGSSFTIDWTKVKSDVASEGHKHILAWLKHEDATWNESRHARMLCSSQCYIEAAMVGPIRLEQISEVHTPNPTVLGHLAQRSDDEAAHLRKEPPNERPEEREERIKQADRKEREAKSLRHFATVLQGAIRPFACDVYYYTPADKDEPVSLSRIRPAEKWSSPQGDTK